MSQRIAGSPPASNSATRATASGNSLARSSVKSASAAASPSDHGPPRLRKSVAAAMGRARARAIAVCAEKAAVIAGATSLRLTVSSSMAASSNRATPAVLSAREGANPRTAAASTPATATIGVAASGQKTAAHTTAHVSRASTAPPITPRRRAPIPNTMAAHTQMRAHANPAMVGEGSVAPIAESLSAPIPLATAMLPASGSAAPAPSPKSALTLAGPPRRAATAPSTLPSAKTNADTAMAAPGTSGRAPSVAAESSATTTPRAIAVSAGVQRSGRFAEASATASVTSATSGGCGAASSGSRRSTAPLTTP